MKLLSSLWIVLPIVQQHALAFHYCSVHQFPTDSKSRVEMAKTAAPQAVQRVAVIGAGIAGLATAHSLSSPFLRRRAVNDGSDGNDGSGDSEGGSSVELEELKELDVFDARPQFEETSGSGIQLSGGLMALRRVNPDLQQKIMEAGLPLHKLESRCRPWFGAPTTAGKQKAEFGWKLLELDIERSILEGDYGLVTDDGQALTCSILRGTLQFLLLRELPPATAVQFGKRLVGLSKASAADANGILCHFQDGTTAGPYDVVLGCDGIQSVVKRFVDTGELFQEPTLNPSPSPSSSKAVYSGIRITFAVQEADRNKNNQNPVVKNGAKYTQFFGNGAYALSAVYGSGKHSPPSKGAYLIYADENYIGPFPKQQQQQQQQQPNNAQQTPVPMSTSSVKLSPKLSSSKPNTNHDNDDSIIDDENVEWKQDKTITQQQHVQRCLSLLQRSGITDAAIDSTAQLSQIISDSDRFFDLGVYFHNPFRWNGWVRSLKDEGESNSDNNVCVLAGDAAHAMPPFLGQGANQALQDAYVLADCIFEYNAQVQQYQNTNPKQQAPIEEIPNLKTTLKDYERRRWKITTGITLKAIVLGYLETGSSIIGYLRDAVFFTLGKVGAAKKIFLESASPKL